jgi:hypothetical protein
MATASDVRQKQMVVKKIVDAGALRSPELETFLSASGQHFAVITDYATVEMFYGDPQVNLRRSLQIISKFSAQAIILKSNAQIWKLVPRNSAGLQRRLQDDRKTRNFPNYCRALFGDADRSQRLSAGISEFGNSVQEAKERFTRLSVSIRAAIGELEAQFTPDDLRAIRAGKKPSLSFSEHALKNIMGLTALYFRDVVRADPMPDSDQVLFSLPFRYVVCSYALSLKWVFEKGYVGVSCEKLRNDYIDVTYSAYATIFDGLITKDKKLRENYATSSWILKTLFHIGQ